LGKEVIYTGINLKVAVAEAVTVGLITQRIYTATPTNCVIKHPHLSNLNNLSPQRLKDTKFKQDNS